MSAVAETIITGWGWLHVGGVCVLCFIAGAGVGAEISVSRAGK